MLYNTLIEKNLKKCILKKPDIKNEKNVFLKILILKKPKKKSKHGAGNALTIKVKGEGKGTW